MLAALALAFPLLAHVPSTILPAALSAAIAVDDADEQYAFVAGLAEKGMHDQVVKEAESFLARYPKHARAAAARYRLACALFELRETVKAGVHFEALASLRDFEFESEVAFRLGQCELESGDCRRAGASFQRVLKGDKSYLQVPALWLLGEAQMRCERYGEAEQSYRAVLSGDAKSEYTDDAVAGLAWCAFKTRRFDGAAQAARSFLEQYPRSDRADELRFLLGEALFELQDPRGALAAYAAVRNGPWLDGSLRGAGFSHAALGDHARAAQAFARVPAELPGSRYAAECALHAGIEFLAAGDHAAALEFLKSDAAGSSAEVYAWRSRAESAAGDEEAALRSLDRALEFEKDAAAIARLRASRADLLTALGKGEEALKEYQRAGSDYALQAAAVAALQAGRTADARHSAEALLERFPESTYRNEARMVVAEAALAEKRFEEAHGHFRSALESERDPAQRLRCQSRISWCRYLAGDSAGAAKSFAKLAQDGGDSPEAAEAQFMTGRSLEAAGDAEGARGAYATYAKRFGRGAHAAEAEFRLARLDSSAGGTSRLESFLREHGEDALANEARLELAERLAAAQRPGEAAAHYRAVIEAGGSTPLAASARYGLAWCLHEQGDAAAAAKLLRPWIEGGSGDEKVRVSALELLVWCEARIPQGTAGLAAAWDALLSSSQDGPRLLRTARSAIEPLRKAGRPREAFAMLDALEARARKMPSGGRGLAASIGIERVYLCLDEGRVEDAERELVRAAEAAEDEAAVAEAAFFVGEARLESGDGARALELYDAAAEITANPARDRALYKAGYARLKAGDAAGAERNFAELLAGHPKSTLFHESLFLLGESHYRQKEFDEACAALERVRKEAPKHEVLPKVLFRLGLARCEREDWKGALEALGALLSAKPDFENLAEAELARGRALAHLDRSREAQGAFERTIALDKGVLGARAHLELGRMHLAAKSYDSALSEFLKVEVLYDLPEETAEAMLGAGRALEASGDAKRAVEQYRKLVEKHERSPAAAVAKRRLAELEPKSRRQA
ncbi:MAG: tetratricopeptide repeat protein [Planctomycetota bacterium]